MLAIQIQIVVATLRVINLILFQNTSDKRPGREQGTHGNESDLEKVPKDEKLNYILRIVPTVTRTNRDVIEEEND